MTSLHYTDSSYPLSSSQYSAPLSMYPLATSFPPSPSSYIIDPMSPTATLSSHHVSFPSLYTSNFSLPPSAFTEPSDLSSIPPLDDESLLLEPSSVRVPSSVSVSEISDSSSVTGSYSPLDSPFVLLPAIDSTTSGSAASSSSVASLSPPPGKRRRVSPLTKEQRAAINKAKHKEIDAARRQREANVVKQLQRLTRKHERDDSDDDDNEQKEEEDAEDEVEDGRRDKVTVLEESAATIAQLRALCRRMRRACNAKDHSIRSLQKHLNAIAVAKTAALNATNTNSYDPHRPRRFHYHCLLTALLPARAHVQLPVSAG